jgi:hypothetical protein
VKKIFLIFLALPGCAAVERCPPGIGLGYDFVGGSGFSEWGKPTALVQAGVACDLTERLTFDTFYINDIKLESKPWFEAWAFYDFGGRPARTSEVNLRKPEPSQ